MDSAKFARWIDSELAKRGLRKRDFYQGSGISSATLSQWRTGLYAPSRSAIEKVEAFFGIKVDILFDPAPLDDSSIDGTFMPEAKQKALASLLENVCADTNITPAFACTRAGVDHNIFNRLRIGRYSLVSRADLMALADFLGCADQVVEILDGETKKDPTIVSDDEVNKMLDIMRALSPAQREAWMKIGLDVANLSQPE